MITLVAAIMTSLEVIMWCSILIYVYGIILCLHIIRTYRFIYVSKSGLFSFWYFACNHPHIYACLKNDSDQQKTPNTCNHANRLSSYHT